MMKTRTGSRWVVALAGVVLALGWLPQGYGAVVTFTDNFNRSTLPFADPLGPGWLSDLPPWPTGNNRWTVDGSGFTRRLSSPALAYVEYPPVGDFYTVGVDIQYQHEGGAFFTSLFGNRPLSRTTSTYIDALYDPGTANDGRVVLRQGASILYDTGGTTSPFPLTGFVLGDWYRFTLYRSNDFARVTMVGTGVNVDSTWKSLPTTPYLGGYAGMSDNNSLWLDNFQLDAEPFVPEPNIVALGALGALIAARVRRQNRRS